MTSSIATATTKPSMAARPLSRSEYMVKPTDGRRSSSVTSMRALPAPNADTDVRRTGCDGCKHVRGRKGWKAGEGRSGRDGGKEMKADTMALLVGKKGGGLGSVEMNGFLFSCEISKLTIGFTVGEIKRWSGDVGWLDKA